MTHPLNVGGNAGLGPQVISATADQIDHVARASGRMVHTTATALSLTQSLHADRFLMIDTNSTVANTFTLPAATGSGDVYTLVNDITQTQGSIVIQSASTADLFFGMARAFDTTAAADAMAFQTTAATRKLSLNRTTTGGIAFDKLIARDDATGHWYVEAQIFGSGTLATPWTS